MFIDTHCHIESKYYEDIDRIIKNAFERGIKIIIASGYSKSSNVEAIQLANKYSNVYAVIGYGPNEVEDVTLENIELLKEQIVEPKVIGIGEIGLDYYWVKDNRDKQKQLFVNQLLIAKEYNMPVVVHNRNADQDTYNILKKVRGEVKGVIHCFNSDILMASKFNELGFSLGIGGVITFKNSKLGEVIKEVPMEYIVLETDSPYLAPEPYRGTQNEPCYIENIAQKLALVKDITVLEVADITSANAIKLFDLKG